MRYLYRYHLTLSLERGSQRNRCCLKAKPRYGCEYASSKGRALAKLYGVVWATLLGECEC